jgi:hypothetical protein
MDTSFELIRYPALRILVIARRLTSSSISLSQTRSTPKSTTLKPKHYE